MTYKLDKSKSLLELEKIHLDETSKNTDFTLNGLYTIGLLSFPYFITVTSQQNRAEILATAIHEVATSNFDDNPQINPLIKIFVVGGGFSGISFVDKLMSMDTNKIRYEINIIEKSDRFCHLQNMCTIRRLHPYIHKWPLEGWKISTANNKIEWNADSADRVAKKFRDRIKLLVHNQTESSHTLKAYLACNNIVFAKENNKYSFSFSGDSYNENERASYYNRDCDIIIFASGFGVEKGITINPKEETKGLSHSYWRNDSFGQKNLFQESETYLVSGSGDGAMVDLFRLLIEDYYQDESLNDLIPLDLDISHFKNEKFNNEKQAEVYTNYLKFIQQLEIMASEPRLDHNLFYYLEQFSQENPGVFQIIFEKFQDRVKANVKCILHIGKPNNKNKVQKIVDNIDITFYNRILFYFVFSVADLEIVVGEYSTNSTIEEQRRDILNISHRYNISERNIIIRHGVLRFQPINEILIDSGFNKVEAIPPIETNEKHKTDYRQGSKSDDILN